ncbi:gliding motility-associated C-terminal domain-containing protein [Chryseolinea serpens]|uniref:Gliding motility-associated C-terminal domain-containing protein n=1 Tax=Chryseolinea serpens TaxID=947013 RepID=A0A1M5QZV6_9BACT|nr:gliding motility-associated C-terminal domain-containing protein [Chryseolinea serpens]SHH19259.1 gliding motility-associated C-terminal domain-containing protein [Chryseolinea serpens]
MKNLGIIACLLLFFIQAFGSMGQAVGRAPVITGQTPSPLSTLQGVPITITLANLIVTPGDPASEYPDGFTLEVNSGKHYNVSGTTVTPDPNFIGLLTVQVRVSEGGQDSKWFNFKINVLLSTDIAPIIIAQTPITISQGGGVTISFDQLTVIDPDDIYPSGFTLTVYGGANYTVNGTTVTPAPNFFGDLQVQVSVNDGEKESNKFKLKITVTKNVAPLITGQVPISINQGQSVAVDFNQLTVTDPDNSYPSGFTLTVYDGANYTVNGTTVTPASNFSGSLKVAVSVNDGKAESNRFDLKIEVKVQPIAPTITGQQPLTVNEDQSIAIKLTDLTVVDRDSKYPKDFTLAISPGAHYTLNGSTVIPEKNYAGPLSVMVSVNDGANDSPPFDLQIFVVAVNDNPVITGQRTLSADQGTTFTISLSDLTVADPDNTYPNDFTLKIAQGNNYVVAGNTINPSPTFVGMLSVTVSVNDGTVSSPNFNVQVEIIAVKKNVAPTIVGQKDISITQNTSITIQLFHLEVSDPDNEYPVGFSLKVFPGTNYTVSGTTVTPIAGVVNGTLRVVVQVNDGLDDSPLYELKIQVTPVSATPQINGQKELVVLEDYAITIYLSDLFVTDADNPNYPQGFTLSVLSNSQGTYSANGNVVTPAPNLNGFIEVGVTVSDGVNTSGVFQLAILVSPVNDAPVITLAESAPIPFEPGTEPMEVFRNLGLADVDNTYLSMAEISFREINHSPKNDELVFDYNNPKIRAIQDSAGGLFLIGNASVEEYQTALRSIKYNYRITEVNGAPEAILSGSRTIYVYVSDGQRVSLTSERVVDIEGQIEIDIPNAFTPNGDNANDTWHVQLLNKDKLDEAIIKVYNKRGLLLYEANGFERDWDAIFRGERLPVDTYFYTIDIKLPYGRQTYKGVVTVLY